MSEALWPITVALDWYVLLGVNVSFEQTLFTYCPAAFRSRLSKVRSTKVMERSKEGMSVLRKLSFVVTSVGWCTNGVCC